MTLLSHPDCPQAAVSTQSHKAREPTIRGQRNSVPPLAPIQPDGVDQPELVESRREAFCRPKGLSKEELQCQLKLPGLIGRRVYCPE